MPMLKKSQYVDNFLKQLQYNCNRLNKKQRLRLRDHNICLFGLFYYPFTLSPVVLERDKVIKLTKETNAMVT